MVKFGSSEKGTKFKKIFHFQFDVTQNVQTLTLIFQFLSRFFLTISGSIIRSMRRLEELLRQMIQAAKNIGNTELENKFSESIKLMKRDIVFAASLYL